jgi:oxygen-independent coproporphyrinogen-3 oxidase
MSERDLVPQRLAMAESAILGLRLVQEGVAEEAFRQRFGRDLDDVYGAEIARLVREGLLTRDGGRLRLSQRGLLLANEVSVRFLPEREQAAGSM